MNFEPVLGRNSSTSAGVQECGRLILTRQLLHDNIPSHNVKELFYYLKYQLSALTALHAFDQSRLALTHRQIFVELRISPGVRFVCR